MSYENSINSTQTQIDKLNSLIKAYDRYIELTKDKQKLWKEEEQKNNHLLKYYDYYIIYISCYANYCALFN